MAAGHSEPAKKFAVQVADFAAVAPVFEAAGGDLDEALKKQKAALADLGKFWGSKAHGPKFGAKYQPLAQKVLALAKIGGVALDGAGKGLHDMGEEYKITEAQIKKAMDQLHLGEK